MKYNWNAPWGNIYNPKGASDENSGSNSSIKASSSENIIVTKTGLNKELIK